jgi:hypothetical protein
MTRKWIVAALLVLAAWSVEVRSASAQYFCSDAFYPCRAYAADLVPYFITHPPIYYNYSVLKPVDPWRPLRQAAVEPVPEPLMVINPYVERQAQAAAPAPNGRVVPLRIKNPYVVKK